MSAKRHPRSPEWCARLSAAKLHDLTGRKFNLLTVLRHDPRQSARAKRPVWVCRCDCGKIKRVRSGNLRVGSVKSCGCLSRRRGPDNPAWKGGRSVVDGYVVLTVYENGRKRHVKEHRLMMERRLGRHLFRHESVHHKNGLRGDNRYANLELWSKTHPAGQRVSDLISFSLEMLRLYSPKALQRSRGGVA